MIRLIVAIDAKRGLADDHGIPWQGRLPSDAAYFRRQTVNGTIVMGFRTYQEFAQPLHERDNYVVARAGGAALRAGFHPVDDLDRFLVDHRGEGVWIIGGARLYELTLPVADELYITQIEQDFGCTKFFPAFDGSFVPDPGAKTHRENGLTFRFEIWRSRPPG